eukprot:282153_1
MASYNKPQTQTIDKGGFSEVAKQCSHVINGIGIRKSDNDIPDLTQQLQCNETNCTINTENWLCLCCYKVFCGRYGNKHMISHFNNSNNKEHCIALGIGDLSFWCYKCDMYLDHLSIKQLFILYKIVHKIKFNENIPNKLEMECDFSAQELYLLLAESTRKKKNEDIDMVDEKENKNIDIDNDNMKPDKRLDYDSNPIYRNENDPNKTSGMSTVINNNEIKEYYDNNNKLINYAKTVAKYIKNSKCCTIYTGAGISTAAKLNDYRGPNGFWTLQANGYIPKTGGISLEQALPTYSHMALNEMINNNLINYIVSTNVDGLHRRSGVKYKHLSELHGNIYLEYCQSCGNQYLRSFDVTKWQKKRFGRRTGRLCNECNGYLRDSVVAFGENLPQKELNNATKYSKISDLVIIIGSSMRVTPACELPSLYKNNKNNKNGKYVIINLQKTPYDYMCDVRVFAKIDQFLKLVCNELKLNVPIYKPKQAVNESIKDLTHIVLDPQF